MRNQVIHFCLVLLFIITFTYARKRFRERKLQDGEGINFPKRVMSRSDAERYVSDFPSTGDI